MIEAIWNEFNWDTWDPETTPLPESPEVLWSISICTVCMGRTNDLKSTLVQNIFDNIDYPNVEFVVLNYNSHDDMDGFMASDQIRPYIRSGKVKYLRTRSPQYYSTSQSRNIAFRNAAGALVTNVDADNYTGKGFAAYLNRLANVCSRKALFARDKWRIHGRIGMFKHEFEALGGYDEELEGYGWEDYSLMFRALNEGHTLMWWSGAGVDFSNRITTPKYKVAENMINTNWEMTETLNMRSTLDKLYRRDHVVNKDRQWGHVEDLELIGE